MLADAAANVGMNRPAALAIVTGDAFAAEIDASDRAAKRAGIRAVPAYCLHGRILRVDDPEALCDDLRSAHRALGPAPNGFTERPAPAKLRAADGLPGQEGQR